jgi:glycosyltransferase involved in cell wall biosynthesis
MDTSLVITPHLRYRAHIPPIPDDVARPLWSVMIPTYNCANYLAKTLRSVLAQDPDPELMQIEVVDDYSTEDDPAAVVERLGGGRVGFYRQPKNVGITKNLETCLKRSRGKLIHLLHGDDYVRGGFYQKMQAAFEQNPSLGAAFCRQIFMDEYGHWQDISPLEQMNSGILTNWLERLALEQRIMTPSMVVRRDVYEQLGGFDSRLLCSEDWEMWVRIAARYPIWYEVEPLAVYRMHLHSNTGRHIRSGEDIRYTRQAIEIFKSYLPPHMANQVSRQARETYALSALDTAYNMFKKRDFVAIMAQVREALQCSLSPKVIRCLVWVLFRGSAIWVRHTSG